MKYYNRTNTCDICREEGRETKLIPGEACREYKGEIWTGRYICNKCRNNIIKSLRDHRTGNLDPNSPQAKGDLFQELTCRWRSRISTITVEDLNVKNDNYRVPIDHSTDSELGIIQTAGRLYDSYNRYWSFSRLEREWEKIFDYEICYCASKAGKTIERIYIIPKEEIKGKRTGITIVKNPKDRWGNSITGWYEQYRIKDEDTIKKINDIWKEIINK